ncbi:MAG: carboxypeptidase, partial [Ilumatobacteraceae bacterium]
FFWGNAPASRLHDEVRPHAEFAVFQALCSPRLEILHSKATSLGGDLYRIEVGIANTGWLPTYVTQKALNAKLSLPVVAEIEGLPVIAGSGGPHARVELGQLGGRLQHHFTYGKNDGTPERTMVQWVVQAWAGREVTVRVSHERAGTATTTIKL